MSYLVLDFGTSSCRASTVSVSGKLISRSKLPVRIDVQGVSAEIDCNYVWGIIVKVIRLEVEKNPDEKIDAVGVSSMLGYVFLDGNNEPVRSAIIWMDNRAGHEADEIRNIINEKIVYNKTGRRLSPELLAPKILWLKKNEVGNYKRTRKIIGLKDEIVRRLSGKVGTDYAHLNYTYLFNIYTRMIDDEIVSSLKIDGDLFPEGTSADEIAGTISNKCSIETGLKTGIPVIAGSSDGTTAMYGGGILESGKAILVSGTTDVLMTKTSKLINDETCTLSINNGMVPDSYAVGGAMGLSGGTLDRIFKLFNWKFSEVIGKVKNVKPGSEGLLFTPGLTGERAPYWAENFKGSLVGINLKHNPEHIVRALFEGISYRIYKLLLIMNSAGLIPDSINVMGGGAKLDVFNQIRADITGLPVISLEDTEATSLGTAIFCKRGIGEVTSLEEISSKWITPSRVFNPNPVTHEIYQKESQTFENYIENNMRRI